MAADDVAVVGSPPSALSDWLKARGFDTLMVNGTTLWRRGSWVGSWDQAPAVYTEQANKERLALEAENAKLRQVGNPMWDKLIEWVLHAGAVAVIGILAYQGEILQMAEHLGPAWSKAANVLVMVTVLWAGNQYRAKKQADAVSEQVAKEQIVGQDRRVGPAPSKE